MTYLNAPVTSAIQDYIIDIVGTAQWAASTDVAATGTVAEVVTRAKRAVANLAMREAITTLNQRVSEGGITVLQAENEVVASKWRTMELQNKFGRDAQRGLDDLLRWLEANAASLPIYAASNERKTNLRNFVNSTRTAQMYVSHIASRFVFLKLRPTLTRIEEDFLRPVLTDDLFLHLRSEIEVGAGYGVYAPLQKLIEPACIHMAFAYAVDDLHMHIDPTLGLFYFHIESTTDYNSRTTSADRHKEADLFARHNRIAVNYFGRLKDHLINNASNYPLYTPPAPAEVVKARPSHDGRIFPGIGLPGNG
jgi:hypothetical protein